MYNIARTAIKFNPSTTKEDRRRFEKEFGSIETAKWNPAVFHLSANAFETAIGIFHEIEGRVLESRFYPHTYKEGHSKPIVYFALTGDSFYARAHPNEENKIAESDLDTRYEEIKHKDVRARSDLKMDFLEEYEKSQEETKRRGELTRKYELCKKEKDTLQEENASLRGEIRSVRQCCQTLKTQLDSVFQQLDRMETKIR